MNNSEINTYCNKISKSMRSKLIPRYIRPVFMKIKCVDMPMRSNSANESM